MMLQSLLIAALLFNQDLDGPSLNQTLTWIQDICAVRAEKQEITIDGCNMSGAWHIADFKPFFGFTTIALRDVDDVTIETSPTRESIVWLHVKTNLPVHFARRTGATRPQNSFGIMVEDKSIAERLHKALVYAAKLCSQQKEPF